MSEKPMTETESEDMIAGAVVNIPLGKIKLMAHQPRTSYDPKYIDELCDTFKRKGFKGSITVWKPSPSVDEYEIISGHCRYLALEKLGAKDVPCAVYEGITPSQAYELAVLFNEQRKDLTLLEIAKSYRVLGEKYGKDAKDIAKTFHISASQVHNTLSVLEQPEYLQEQAHTGKITLYDITLLKQIENEEDRVRLAHKVVSGEIAKTRLNDEVKLQIRRKKVVQAIPDLSADGTDEPEPKDVTTQSKTHIPANFRLYFTFGAATRIDWELLPQRNILVSAYHIIKARSRLPMIESIIEKRKKMDHLMIDSSAIIAMDKKDMDWFKRQKEIVALANAVEADVVVMLDILCKPKLLEACNLTVQEAQAMTIENAENFMPLETSARKVYVLQGFDKKDYLTTIQAYDKLGIFKDSNNIVGVGSSAGEPAEKTLDRFQFCCSAVRKINPKMEIHAFGIGSPSIITQLYQMGVTQVDNQTPMVLTRLNKWVNPANGEAFSGLTLSESRISALYQAQILWNYGAYWCGVNNEFAKLFGKEAAQQKKDAETTEGTPIEE